MKMININIKDYGTIISDENVGKKIYDEINEAIINQTIVNVDFSGVVSMATFCAKQIFGQLYKRLGASMFVDLIFIHNASDDIKVVISDGISDALIN